MVFINRSDVKMVSLAIVLMTAVLPLAVISTPVGENKWDLEHILNKTIALTMRSHFNVLTASTSNSDVQTSYIGAGGTLIPENGRWIITRVSEGSDHLIIRHEATGNFLEAIETPLRIQEIFSKPRNATDKNQVWTIVPRFEEDIHLFHLVSIPSGEALDANGISGTRNIYLNPFQDYNVYQMWFGTILHQ